MSYFTKEQIASFANASSPFYQQLYSGIEPSTISFEKLPIATPEKVKEIAKDDHKVFIGMPQTSGICYTSSGTTGIAKLTKCDREEWNETTRLIAVTHWKNSFLRDYDVVANLASPGHASIMLVHDVLQHYPGPITEVIIGTDQEFLVIYSSLKELKVTVLAGVYSIFIGLSDWMVRSGLQNHDITSLLGGGELLYGAQVQLIKKAFPNAVLKSFLYGSTDSGSVGYNTYDSPENVFSVFTSASYLEIIDPWSHEVIFETGKEGLLVITNLLRTNAPVVRYCNGDFGKWITSPKLGSPTFELLGRSYPKVNFSGLSLSGSTIAELIKQLDKDIPLIRLEAELDRSFHSDEIRIYFSVFDFAPIKEKYEDIIRKKLFSLLPSLVDSVDKGEIVLKIQIKDLSNFSILSRKRGKLLVDKKS